MIHWLLTAFNTYVLHVEKGNGYQFWSGLGSDLGEITIIGMMLGAWHRFNCHEKGCWRPVRHGKTHCPRHEKCH